MGRLIYSMPTSLDGFIAEGDYSWAAPDEEVMAALTADAAEVSTYLYGRRMYETMAVWETNPAAAEQSQLSAGVHRDLTLRRDRRFSNGMLQTTYDVIGHDQS
jgi:hypothetical protein